MSIHAVTLAAELGHPAVDGVRTRLYAHWLARHALPGHYIPIDVAPADLGLALKALPRMGFAGVNLQAPYKEAVLAVADGVTDRAALIGAANTLSFHRDGRIYADNTEGTGFLANLRQGAPEWQPASGPAAVLGAGSTARAIVSALIEAGVQEIRVANRTRPRAEALRAHFGARISVHDWARVHDMIAGCVTLVNTTSLGGTGKPPLQLDLAFLSREAVVSDVILTPLHTAFLAGAAARGCRIVDGLGMLLHQALPAFERWFGVRPEVDDESRQAALAP